MKKIIVSVILLLTLSLGGCVGVPYVNAGYGVGVGYGVGYGGGYAGPYGGGYYAPYGGYGGYGGHHRHVTPSYSPSGYNGTYVTP